MGWVHPSFLLQMDLNFTAKVLFGHKCDFYREDMSVAREPPRGR